MRYTLHCPKEEPGRGELVKDSFGFLCATFDMFSPFQHALCVILF